MELRRTLIVAAALGAQLVLSSTATAQVKRELVYGSFASPNAPDSKATQAFLDRLNGENLSVRFRSAFGGSMGGPREVLMNIGSGVLQTGQGIDGLMPKEYAGGAVLRNLGTLHHLRHRACGAHRLLPRNCHLPSVHLAVNSEEKL